ncbi:MAG: hypothetical protein ACN6I4_00030 [bacterium]
MDIPTIAAETVALLSPFLLEGGKELTKSATKELWSFLKNKFSGKKEAKQLEEWAQSPTEERLINRLEMALENIMQENEDFRMELENRLEKVKQEIKHNTIKDNTKTVAGNNIQSGNDTNITIS